jgi:hypothetical protein
MFIVKRLSGLALTAALGLVPAACAQQDSPPAMAGMSGMQGQQGTSGVNIRSAADGRAMGNMQGHDMSGMDMQTIMNRCADMRRQMAQGTMSSAPDMQRMMAQCDQMDRQMGGGMGGGGHQMPMPGTSRSR